MRYDDRLATVLGQPAADARGKAVQWRQLVELLSRGEGEISQDLADRALARIAHMMKDLPMDLLSATSRAIAGRAVPAELVALFAARGANASAALLTAADLTPAGWKAVRAVAADDVHPFLAALGHAEARPSITSPPTASPPPASPSPAKPSPASASPPSPLQDRTPPKAVSAPVIARAPAPAKPTLRPDKLDVVAASKPFDQAPRPPLQSAPRMATSDGIFRWEAGPNGEIDWVEGVPRSAMIGRNVADIFGDTFAARLPFADAPLTFAEEGPLIGEWRWSGTPTFFPDTGRFTGYRGVARREGSLVEPPQHIPAAFLPAEDDGLRELMHELRTPLNAIIGFGEIIEGQYLGPAHRTYRERAAEIVRQARSSSDAVDNLDLAARLRSGRAGDERVSNLDTIRAMLEEASVEAAHREVNFAVDHRIEDARIALPPLLVQRLVRQFAAAMSTAAVAGERLVASVDRLDGKLAIGFSRAMALRGLSEERIMAGRAHAETRFALRLVQGVASMTGGRLDIGADRLVLILPLAD